MFKGALAYVGVMLPKLRAVTAREAGTPDVGRNNLRREWARLVESDFDEQLVHEFAAHTPAQELPTEVFDALLTSGNRDLASYFFEYDPHKGDRLDGNKVRLILETPGLQFLNSDGGFVRIENYTQRAVRLLTGYADIEVRGLARLIVDRYTALVGLALWPREIFGDEILTQVTANGGSYRPSDVKRFCASPDNYSREDGTTISDVDLLVIRTIVKNPGRVFEILFQGM